MAATACPLAAPFEINGVCCPVGYTQTTTSNKGITYCHNKYFTEDNGNYICRSEKLSKCSDLSVFNGYSCNEVENEDKTETIPGLSGHFTKIRARFCNC